MNRTWKVLTALACAAFIATRAFADVKAFNAAVKAGDYKTAAEAKTTWSNWNKTDPDTAVVAREFGFASYVAGDYAAARDFGQFLKDNGASLLKPDEQPATSIILLRIAEFRLQPGEMSRAALLESLKVRRAAPGLDNISLLATEALYRADWAAADWTKTVVSSNIAADLMARGGVSTIAKTLEARLYSGAADFLANSTPPDYDRLGDVHDAVIDALDNTTDARLRVSLIDLKFQAEAWTDIAAIGLGSKPQIDSNIPKSANQRSLKKPATPIFSAQPDPDDRAYCKARLDGKGMKFPHTGVLSRGFGIVLVRMSFDEQGVPTSWDKLTSIPSANYGEALMSEVPMIRRLRGSEDRRDCILAAKDRIVTFVF